MSSSAQSSAARLVLAWSEKIAELGTAGPIEDIPLRDWVATPQRTSASCVRSLWVARNSVFLIVPSVVFSIPATVRSRIPW